MTRNTTTHLKRDELRALIRLVPDEATEVLLRARAKLEARLAYIEGRIERKKNRGP